MKNKKKLISLLLILTLIVVPSSIQAFNKNVYKTSFSVKTINVNYQFSSPIIKEDLNGITVHLDDLNDYYIVPGQPILPISIEVLEFPLGSRITDVICTTGDINEYKITKEVIPGVSPISSIYSESYLELKKDPLIYQHDDFFPEMCYNIRASAGLNKTNQHTTFFSIQFYPISYNPIQQKFCQ